MSGPVKGDSEMVDTSVGAGVKIAPPDFRPTGSGASMKIEERKVQQLMDRFQDKRSLYKYLTQKGKPMYPFSQQVPCINMLKVHIYLPTYRMTTMVFLQGLLT